MRFERWILVVALGGTALLVRPRAALAHCDTLEGPVVKDAQAALAAGDSTRALKWVAPASEGEVRMAFQRALVVRALGPEARDLADRFFFETLVRLHRQGEGAPFNGLKPAGTPVEPIVAISDQALETGSPDALSRTLTSAVDQGLRARFARALEARDRAAKDVDAGREFVAAYVELTHYAERVHETAAADARAHEETATAHGH